MRPRPGGKLPIVINAVLPQKLVLPLVLAQFFHILPHRKGDGAAELGPGPAQQVQIVHIEGSEPAELFPGRLPDIAPPDGIAPGDYGRRRWQRRGAPMRAEANRARISASVYPSPRLSSRKFRPAPGGATAVCFTLGPHFTV